MSSLAASAVVHPRTSLFIEQLVDETMLREAWHRVQRGGRTAGVDGVSIETFRPHAEERLHTLRKAILTDTYCPAPVKRIQMPKPDGGVRVLGVPTITDRIAQTAAALVLHDRVTSLFSGRSFAYRPFLGPRRAAVYLRTQMSSAAWVVTADVAKFFDNVEHRILASQLRTAGVDDGGIRLILRWLLAPAQDGGRRFQPVKGLPQGSPLAPVLANLYLTGFDGALEAEGFAHVRYADDFIVLAPDEAGAQRALQYVAMYLASRLRLQIKPAKTQLASVDDGFTFVGFRFTRDRWTASSESVDRFKMALAEVWRDGNRAALVDIAKAHNDLVRGWRGYYFGNSADMDRQLGELDEWRVKECATQLASRGVTPDAASVWFERLVEHDAAPAPPGAYADRDLPQYPLTEPTDSPIDQWHGAASARPAAAPEARTFSTSQQLHDAEIGRRQRPVVFEDGWLRIPTHGAFVTKSHALVVVRRKKQVIFECPFEDVSHLTIEADGVAVSTTVLDECVRRRIAVALCRLSGRPIARFVSATPRLDPQVVRRQLRARSGRSGTPLVTSILAAKVSNQRALLLYHSKYHKRAAAVRERLLRASAAIEPHLSDIEQASDVPMRTARRRLFLAEAHAAAHYWQGFAALVPSALGFAGRHGRGATDVVNKALNYGYAHLLSRVWLAVHFAGLEPSLGLLHTGRRKSAGLVFDLMEPFRQPVVDRAVLGLVGRRAELALNKDGQLTLRTRDLLQQALARTLNRTPSGRSLSLSRQIQHDVVALRRALVDARPHRAYRMTW